MIEVEASLNDLEMVSKSLQQALPEGGVIILQGDLAAGKTTLTQAFVKYLGVDDVVTSPTFSLQQCYGDSLFHYDIYNHGLDHFLSLGMLEELEKPGYHLIEWGDDALCNLLKSAGIETLVVNIIKLDNTKRLYRIKNA